MEHLHAYWRIDYVRRADKGNPFRNLDNPEEDQERGVLARTAYSILLLNRYPYTPGHLLVVPKRQVSELEGLEGPEREDLVGMIILAKRILKKTLTPEGFNVGWNVGRAAGAGITDHLHIHVVPRWQGDTNFMPVLGQTHIVPEALSILWQKLKPFADEESQLSMQHG